MRNTIKDANLADKLSAEDKAAIEKAVDHVVEWLDHNQVGEKMTCNERDKCLHGPTRVLISFTCHAGSAAGRGGGNLAAAHGA